MYDIVFFSFHLCPENLVAKTGQFVSLFVKGWERVDWGGCIVDKKFITLLHFRSKNPL